MVRLAFLASDAAPAQAALPSLVARHGQRAPEDAEAIVALGGDGFMLQTLHATEGMGLPVYGMNRGSVGFLMNDFAVDALPERLARAEETVIHPLAVRAIDVHGAVREARAINEVSLFRAAPQAAKLRVSVGGRVRLAELICDGALVATPAGSTAYNHSAHGPILPIGANVLALTAMAAFRPRRWQGAILPMDAVVRFDVLEPEKRPVTTDADGRNPLPDTAWAEIRVARDVRHRLLFDPGHGLEERLAREQFE